MSIIEARVDSLEESTRQLNLALSTFLATMARLNDRIDSKFEAIDRRFEAVEARLEAVETRLGRIEESIASLPDAIQKKIGYVKNPS